MPQDPATASALIIGEALVDVVTDASGHQEDHPGGSPMNVAVGLSRLQVPTILATHIGDDAHGALITDHLTQSGVIVFRVGPNTTATSTAHAVLDADGAASYTFDVTWEPGPLEVDTPELIHTGSLATCLTPGADVVEETLREAPAGTLVSFDPNVRPSLAPSREALRDRVESIAGLAHVVKMSDEDAAWLHPEESLEQIVDRYRGQGGGGVFVLTRGAHGCTIGTREWVVDLPAAATEVVDTIGAGDAFMSGLLFALVSSGQAQALTRGGGERADLEECARVALRSAAVTVSRAGANPPSRQELVGG
ncbi:carbohydrate kinase family protein [Nesterenkonia suensis]